jgi:hypothetical protein
MYYNLPAYPFSSLFSAFYSRGKNLAVRKTKTNERIEIATQGGRLYIYGPHILVLLQEGWKCEVIGESARID